MCGRLFVPALLRGNAAKIQEVRLWASPALEHRQLSLSVWACRQRVQPPQPPEGQDFMVRCGLHAHPPRSLLHDPARSPRHWRRCTAASIDPAAHQNTAHPSSQEGSLLHPHPPSWRHLLPPQEIGAYGICQTVASPRADLHGLGPPRPVTVPYSVASMMVCPASSVLWNTPPAWSHSGGVTHALEGKLQASPLAPVLALALVSPALRSTALCRSSFKMCVDGHCQERRLQP